MGMNTRHYTPFDQLLIHFDKAVRTVFGAPATTGRPNPANGEIETSLSDNERRVTVGLMRVNHAGEVAAQALYQGQGLTAKLPNVREKMERAALEENDHLAWCEQRLAELGSRTSLLNPLWYAGSFAIGAAAGLAGDKWSLGFVVETERQVVHHLDQHLARLPEADRKSRAILEQMKEEEQRHATAALAGGAAELPAPVKGLMRLTSKVMTTTAFYI